MKSCHFSFSRVFFYHSILFFLFACTLYHEKTGRIIKLYGWMCGKGFFPIPNKFFRSQMNSFSQYAAESVIHLLKKRYTVCTDALQLKTNDSIDAMLATEAAAVATELLVIRLILQKATIVFGCLFLSVYLLHFFRFSHCNRPKSL